MARAVKNIMDDVKNRSKTEGVTADELIGLFKEAYGALASDENLKDRELQQIESYINNVLKNNKELFDEKKRKELQVMRETKGASIEKTKEQEASTENETEEQDVRQDSEIFIGDEENNEITLSSVYESETSGGRPFRELLSEEDFAKAEELLKSNPSMEELNAMDFEVLTVDKDDSAYKEKYGENYAIIARLVKAYLKKKNGEQEASTENETEEQEVKQDSEDITGDKENKPLTLKEYWEQRRDYINGEFIPFKNLVSEEDLEKAEKLLESSPDIYMFINMKNPTPEQEEEYIREYGENYKNIASFVNAYMYHLEYYNDKESSKDEPVIEDGEKSEIDKILAEKNISDEKFPFDVAVNICGEIISPKESETLSFINMENMPSKEEIKEMLDSNTSITNNEHILLAHKYFNDDDNEKYSDDIMQYINSQLLEIIKNDGKEISMNNISSIIALADRTDNLDLRQLIYKYVALYVKTYDERHFGDLTPEELLTNYEALHEKASKIDPFSIEPKENDIDLNKDIDWLDDDGKPLSKEDVKQSKDLVAEMARELAVQELLKQGKDVTDEALKEEILKQTHQIIFAANTNIDKASGRIVVTESSLASSMAVKYIEANSFKNRVKRKFNNNKFVKAVTKRVDAIDKKLTNKYGDKYKKAKQVVDFVSKTSYTALKSAAIFTGLSFIPGGIPAYMAYNAFKSWKNTAKTLKDEKLSRSEKIGAVISSTATTVFSAVGVGVGIDFTSALSSGAGFQITRMGVIAGANSSSNILDSLSLRIKQGKLKRKLKKVEDKESVEAKKLATELEEVNEKISANRGAGLKKFGGAIVGMLIAQGASAAVNDVVHGNEASLDDSENQGANSGNEGQNNSAQNAEAQNNANVEYQAEQGDENAIVSQSSENEDMARTGDANNADAEAGDNEEGLTEAQTRNLNEAKEAGSSGLGNESSYDHTLRHLNNLDDARITDNVEMTENLCEQFGENANRVTIACKMAPYALQEALGLDLPAGENPTTYQMLTYMSEHPLTEAQMESLNSFMEQNFDGVRFRTENFSDWNRPNPEPVVQQQTFEQQQPIVAEHTHNVNQEPVVKYSSDNQHSDVGAQNEGNETREPEVQEQQTGTETREPEVQEQQVHTETRSYNDTVVYQYDMTNPFDYAAANGFVYDETLSIGLNMRGDGLNFDGFAGAFRSIEDPNKVIYLPNDMVGDMHHMRAVDIHYAENQQYHDSDMYHDKSDILGINKAHHGSHFRTCHSGGVGYYSSGDRFYDACNKTHAVVSTIEHATHSISHIVSDVSRLFDRG